MPDQPTRKALDLLFKQRMRRIAPSVERIPAAELDFAELRMRERIPRAEALAAEHVVVPLQQLQVVLDRMLAIPLDELVVADTGLALRAPDLNGPREHAAVIVHPVVECAGDDFLGVVAEIVKHRDI